MKLHYLTKTALWGGVKLKEEYGKSSEHEKVSESWELSVREGDTCLIENGSAAGMLLSDYFADYGKHLVGRAFVGDRFPLLIKFIDARECLSVQVHPDDAYALANERDPGKTEMWYVVEAEEGAELIYGLREDVTGGAFCASVDKGDYDSVMRRVPVRAGETYFIPSGMLHAIGAGLLIAEIQQNSDLTYRVYDFDRKGADGKLRPLHVDKAKAVTRPFTEEEIGAVRYSRDLPEDENVLADCPYFRVTRVEGAAELDVTDESFTHLLCVEGEGCLMCDKEKYPVKKGDSCFLPLREWVALPWRVAPPCWPPPRILTEKESCLYRKRCEQPIGKPKPSSSGQRELGFYIQILFNACSKNAAASLTFDSRFCV